MTCWGEEELWWLKRHSSAENCNSVLGALVSRPNGIHIRASFVGISFLWRAKKKKERKNILFMTVNRSCGSGSQWNGLVANRHVCVVTSPTVTATLQLKVGGLPCENDARAKPACTLMLLSNRIRMKEANLAAGLKTDDGNVFLNMIKVNKRSLLPAGFLTHSAKLCLHKLSSFKWIQTKS